MPFINNEGSMIYRIQPSSLCGKISIPASKSHTLRAILFGMMGKGTTCIYNYLASPDTTAMVAACRHFGCKIHVFSDRIEIDGLEGRLSNGEGWIDAGNSGLVLRFIGALSALNPFPTVITGDSSICSSRPVLPLLSGLEQLGAEAVSLNNNGHAPISIRGPLIPGRATVFGEDSQPISGLLIAASFAKGMTELEVINPGEKPWVALTLDWFDRLGITYTNEGYEKYKLFGYASYEGFSYVVPGDFSTAAFPLAAALITNSELVLENIDFKDIQGDKAIIPLLQKMGARIEMDVSLNRLYVRKGGELEGMRIDVNDMIDALPILAVLGCFAKGRMELYGGKIARKKECDRIRCMALELKKMGAKIEEKEDGLIIEPSFLKGANLESHCDHRVAMSLAVAAMAAQGESIIRGTECIAKSCPDFEEQFQAIGAKIERRNEAYSLRI